MGKEDKSLALMAVGVGGFIFSTWTLYRAVPMLWGWSIESLGGPPITGMQALALASLVNTLRPGPVMSDTDSNGEKRNPYIVIWAVPAAVWMSVAMLRLASWLIGVPL